jgi:hypothetical protein
MMIKTRLCVELKMRLMRQPLAPCKMCTLLKKTKLPKNNQTPNFSTVRRQPYAVSRPP